MSLKHLYEGIVHCICSKSERRRDWVFRFFLLSSRFGVQVPELEPPSLTHLFRRVRGPKSRHRVIPASSRHATRSGPLAEAKDTKYRAWGFTLPHVAWQEKS